MTVLALIATRKGLFQLNHDLTIELVGFEGIPVSQVLACHESDCWYVALDHGHFGVKLHRSDNTGKDWHEIATPSYPTSVQEDAASLKLIWSLEYAEGSGSTTLWAGTIPGGLFYSADKGDSWQLNETLWKYTQEQEWFGGGFDEAGIHSIDVHPENPNEILIAVSCAGVWATQDGGDSWQNQSKGMRAEYMPPERAYDPVIQDPHRLVRCPSQPEKLWVQHHNGIFKSDDNAKSWTEITDVLPSAFGFAVAVHPNDPDTAWFVPAVKDENRVPVDGQFMVNRTRDGGQTFEPLTDGLPQSLSYDLVYRHGLAIDKTGNQLLMGSTTGNLWLSQDQGESWQTLSHYLPPIYAVRFIS